jgi:RimJ/RimL family protein N-acetyltransferase
LIPLTPAQLGTMERWLAPERPGPLVAQHVARTGYGSCLADRWPDPRALIVETGGNYTLAGNPAVLDPADLADRVTGFVEAPPAFLPLLRRAVDDVVEWPRVVFALTGPPRVSFGQREVRRLEPGDADHLSRLSDELSWIAKTWGGPTGLSASGTAWGAFVAARLVAVACPFFVGGKYEDLGVVTEPEFRGLGLSSACAAGVCADVLRRGRTPSWTTSPDNAASLRVAAKLGFVLQRRDRLFAVRVPIPSPPRG